MINLYDSNGRKQWVDLGKGISILLVLLFHTEEYLPIVDTGTTEIFSFFRMPFFFFLSGYVFTSDYRRFSLRRKLKQILRGIVWTYLIFTSIVVVPKCVANHEPIIEGVKTILLGYATWFVVSLGVAQLLFAVVLSKTKNLKVIAAFMVVSVGIGIVIKSLTDDILPYQLDKAFFVVFFFGLGFFYRIYEHLFRHLLKWQSLLVAVAVYAALMWMEKAVLHNATNNVFWNQSLTNFPLFMVYTIVGIAMMLILVNLAYNRHLNTVCYIGANSLIYYYLNGGVVRCWRYVYNIIDSHLHVWPPLGFTMVFLAAAATLLAIVYVVKRYCPVLVGDKKSFNRIFPRIKW